MLDNYIIFSGILLVNQFIYFVLCEIHRKVCRPAYFLFNHVEKQSKIALTFEMKDNVCGFETNLYVLKHNDDVIESYKPVIKNRVKYKAHVKT